MFLSTTAPSSGPNSFMSWFHNVWPVKSGMVIGFNGYSVGGLQTGEPTCIVVDPTNFVDEFNRSHTRYRRSSIHPQLSNLKITECQQRHESTRMHIQKVMSVVELYIQCFIPTRGGLFASLQATTSSRMRGSNA